MLPIAGEGTGAQRIAKAGLTTLNAPTGLQIAAVGLQSPADKAGFEQGFVVKGIESPIERPAQEWLFVPALIVLAAIMLLQRRRLRTDAFRAPSASASPNPPSGT
jgi:hypothetical protein